MVVGSFSYTVVNVYAASAPSTSAAAATAAAAPASEGRTDETDDSGRRHHGHRGHLGHHGRQGGLMQAIRSALQELMQSPAAATPPATTASASAGASTAGTPAGTPATTAAATTAAATPPAAPRTQPDATAAPGNGIDAFMHALWQALRDAPATSTPKDDKAACRYGSDLSQRLQSLATSLGSSDDRSKGLVDSFGAVLKAIGTGSADSSTNRSTDARALLRGFLQRIAGVLGSSGATTAAASTGQLVNTCA